MEPADSGTRPAPDEPNAPPESAPTWAAGDRERRLRALRELAHQQLNATSSARPAQPPPGGAPSSPAAPPTASSPRPAAPSLAPRRPHRRRPPLWLAGALALLAIVVVAAGVVVFRGRIAPAVAKHPAGPALPALSINPANDLIACSVDAEWSPNSAYIAMLGYRGQCPGIDDPQSVSGQLDIYDAASGQLFTSSQLDQQILAQASSAIAAVLPSANIFGPYIDYTGLLWSPDSTFLAVTFAILDQNYMFPAPNEYSGNTPQPTPAIAGVWTSGHLSPNSSFGAGRVLVTPFTLGVDPLRRPAIEWDLTQNRLVSTDVSPPPALGYVWSSDGSIVGRDLVAPSQAPAPVSTPQIGTPDGGAYFSIWQPADVEQGFTYTQTSPAGQPLVVQGKAVPNLYLWYSDFPAWSPDGRYLVTPATYGGRFIIPGQPDVPLSALKATGQAQAALLPFHDAAQQNLFPQQAGAALAWRPDGGVLAALIGPVQKGARLDLYNCASGVLLRTIAVPPRVGGETVLSLSFLGPNPDGIYLRWSPDGAHLLLYNPYGDGKINVWNVTGF